MNVDTKVSIGHFAGCFGVKGWVKVFSYTEPKENILAYSPWILIEQGKFIEFKVIEGSRHGKTLVAHLDGIESREDAAKYTGQELYINRGQLPEIEQDEYYWADLIGLTVLTVNNINLGRIDSLIETGANDVLVVKGDQERLIPFLQKDVVRSVDLEGGKIHVSWDPDF